MSPHHAEVELDERDRERTMYNCGTWCIVLQTIVQTQHCSRSASHLISAGETVWLNMQMYVHVTVQ